MADQMPPASNADPLEKRTVALPPSLWKSCELFAETDGEKLSEVYRRIITLGISAEKARRTDDLSYENKALVNERLRAKRAGAIEAIAQLEAEAGEHEGLVAAIDAIKTWLSE